jgi:hypothetical protein
MIMTSQGINLEGLHHKEDHSLPGMQIYFMVISFYCTNFGHKVANCKDYKRNVQTRSAYVARHNIECYKCHNYGHIASDCRSMIDTSMKENIVINIRKYG